MRMLEHSFEPEAGVRRVEVITGTGRRRRWSVDDKARIIAETLAPGAVTSEVARRHGMSPQQIFGWRREAKQGLLRRARLCASGAGNACDTGAARRQDGDRDYRRLCGRSGSRGGGRGDADPGRAGAEGGVMIVPGVGAKVLIALRPVDFRKGVDVLAALVRETRGPILSAG